MKRGLDPHMHGRAGSNRHSHDERLTQKVGHMLHTFDATGRAR